MVYGQTEVTRDLMAARRDSGAPIIYGVSEVAIEDVKSDRPVVSYVSGGEKVSPGVRFLLPVAMVSTAFRGKAFHVTFSKSMKACGRLAG